MLTVKGIQVSISWQVMKKLFQHTIGSKQIIFEGVVMHEHG